MSRRCTQMDAEKNKTRQSLGYRVLPLSACIGVHLRLKKS